MPLCIHASTSLPNRNTHKSSPLGERPTHHSPRRGLPPCHLHFHHLTPTAPAYAPNPSKSEDESQEEPLRDAHATLDILEVVKRRTPRVSLFQGPCSLLAFFSLPPFPFARLRALCVALQLLLSKGISRSSQRVKSLFYDLSPNH